MSCSSRWRGRAPSPSHSFRRLHSLALFLTFYAMLQCVYSDNKSENNRRLNDLFGRVDRNGDGEIACNEANQFVSTLSNSEENSALLNFFLKPVVDFSFSYGGSSISTSEIFNHLNNVLTGDWIVDWVTHGLKLPEYASRFRDNAINGLDFPHLISDNGLPLKNELGIESPLHNRKMYFAILCQIFGIGTMPSPPTNLSCSPAANHGIHLQWFPPEVLGSPPAHKYLIQRRLFGSRSVKWQAIADSENLTVSDLFLSDFPDATQGTLFDYRIQSWSGHGPSNWTFVEKCSVGGKNPAKEEAWVMKWIFTGACIIFLLISRHIVSNDVLPLITCILWDRLKLGTHLFKTLDYFIKRMAVAGLYLHAKTICITEYLKSVREAIAYHHEHNHDESLQLDAPLVHVLKCSSQGHPTQSENRLAIEGEATTLDGSNLSSSHNGRSMNRKNSKLEPKPEARKSRRIPKPDPRRCNNDSCLIRFDKRLSISSWIANWNKHYCKTCHRVYCCDHTPISPHWSMGNCGIASKCICYFCFNEERNKLKKTTLVFQKSASSRSNLSSSLNGSDKYALISSLGNSFFSSSSDEPSERKIEPMSETNKGRDVDENGSQDALLESPLYHSKFPTSNLNETLDLTGQIDVLSPNPLTKTDEITPSTSIPTSSKLFSGPLKSSSSGKSIAQSHSVGSFLNKKYHEHPPNSLPSNPADQTASDTEIDDPTTASTSEELERKLKDDLSNMEKSLIKPKISSIFSWNHSLSTGFLSPRKEKKSETAQSPDQVRSTRLSKRAQSLPAKVDQKGETGRIPQSSSDALTRPSPPKIVLKQTIIHGEGTSSSSSSEKIESEKNLADGAKRVTENDTSESRLKMLAKHALSKDRKTSILQSKDNRVFKNVTQPTVIVG